MEAVNHTKTVVKEILKKLGLEAKVSVATQEDFIVVNLTSNESGLLIGAGGQTLDSFQHLVRQITQKKLAEQYEDSYFARIKIMIDVGAYRQRQSQQLVRLAQSLANQVARSRVPQTLRPMNAYERRMIHLSLASTPNVVTESFGEGPERRVMIKPKI